MNSQDDPPAYTLAPESPQDNQPTSQTQQNQPDLFRRCASDRLLTFQMSTRMEAERLRSFLTTASELAQPLIATLEHYIQSAGDRQDSRNYGHLASDEDKILLGSDFNANPKEPALALGVPLDLVCRRLIEHRRYQSIYNQYQEAITRIPKDKGEITLAHRFVADAEFLLPRLIPPQDPRRQAMLDAVQAVRVVYFTRIIGVSDAVVGQEEIGQTLQRRPLIQFGKTQYLKEYTKVKDAEQWLLQQYPEPKALSKQVKGTLLRLERYAFMGQMPRVETDTRWNGQGALLDFHHLQKG